MNRIHLVNNVILFHYFLLRAVMCIFRFQPNFTAFFAKSKLRHEHYI